MTDIGTGLTLIITSWTNISHVIIKELYQAVAPVPTKSPYGSITGDASGSGCQTGQACV